MEDSIAVFAACVAFLALSAQWVAWRVGLPSILFLIAFGLLVGPATGWLNPDQVLGDLLFPFVSFAVAIILFEGSLTLQFHEIRGHGNVVRNMVTGGFVVTWVITAVASAALAGLSWRMAFLFGAIMIVTGPTVIVPMLRAVRPNARIASILRWEGILIDTVGAFLAVLVFNFIIAIRLSDAFGGTALLMGRMLAAGVITGLVAGWFWARVLRSDRLPTYLHNMGTLMLVLITFAVANLWEHEAGLLAVTIMGVWLANDHELHLDDILNFKESLTLSLISAMFIILAARLDPAQLPYLISGPALGVLAVIMFVARPAKIFAAAWGSTLSWQEKAALSWIAPRGIVAAAISALFAYRLQSQGVAGAERLVPLTFTVIAGTVIWQSLTSGPVVRALGVAGPPPFGLLIVGGNHFARSLGEALHAADLQVLLVTSQWDHARLARMAGVPVYLGNPLSDHAERHLDMSGIGTILALSSQANVSDLVSRGFAPELGRRNVYVVPPGSGDEKSREDKYWVSSAFRGRRAFAEDLNVSALDRLMQQDYQPRATQLTKDFGFAEYREKHPDALPLLAWNEQRRPRILTPSEDWEPPAGWTLLALRPPEPDPPAPPAGDKALQE